MSSIGDVVELEMKLVLVLCLNLIENAEIWQVVVEFIHRYAVIIKSLNVILIALTITNSQ